MATPIPEIRVDWRNDGFNFITNHGFEGSEAGWSVAAGINAAGTSITRTVSAPYMGTAVGRLVTTAVNTSGANYVLTGTFTSGRTYRFRVFLKSVSGTTGCAITIGSLGTPADRAQTSMNLTMGWLPYTVDWTPSANRTDVQVAITNFGAEIGTYDIDDAEVYETIDDITSYSDFLTYTRGANFDGSIEAPGTCTFRLRNDEGRFSPDNVSSPLTGLLVLGRAVWIRATYEALPYALFYGTIRRIVPTPGNKLVEIVCEDPLYRLSRFEVSIPLSLSRSIHEFREEILGEIIIQPTQQNLANGVEGDIVYTEADQINALSVLSELNKATGTVHYIKPDPSSSVLYKYTTVDRATIQGQVVDETFNDTLTDLQNYDLTDEALVNSQRVFPTARRLADMPEVVWEGNVPFTIDVDTTVWAGRRTRSFIGPNTFGQSTSDITFADPTFSQTLTIAGTGIDSSVLTPFSRSAKIVINTTTGAEVETLFITGIPAPQISGTSVLVEDLTVIPERYAGADIATDFISSDAMATGLADWWVYRYKGGAARPDIALEQRFPSQLQRDITDRLSITFPLLGITSKQFLIRSLTTTVQLASTTWRTDYNLEATPTALNLFTVGGTADQGVGGTAVLGH